MSALAVKLNEWQHGVENGELFNVTCDAKEVGITQPTAITQKAWSNIVFPDSDAVLAGETEDGRLHIVLATFAENLILQEDKEETITYRIVVTFSGYRLEKELVAHVTAENEIIISLPEETF